MTQISLPIDADLAKLLRARAGHFELESGHHGEMWLDLDALFRRPKKLRPYVEALSKALSPHRADAVCGPLIGGALLAEMIAGELDREFFYSERHTITTAGKISASYTLSPGQCGDIKGKRVAVVDDVINAASAIKGTVAALERCGATPVALGALLLLGTRGEEFARTKDLRVERVASLANRIWEAAECPLCAKGEPLERLAPI